MMQTLGSVIGLGMCFASLIALGEDRAPVAADTAPAPLYATQPIAARIVGIWQLRKHEEQDRLRLRTDGTFDWTLPIDGGRVNLVGEWDIDGRTVLLLFGEEKLSLSLGRIDAVTPRWLAFQFGDRNLMFERVLASESPKAAAQDNQSEAPPTP